MLQMDTEVTNRLQQEIEKYGIVRRSNESVDAVQVDVSDQYIIVQLQHDMVLTAQI